MADSSTPQFDSHLGGSQPVPSYINVSEFIKNRMEEVVMLTETIKESPFRGQTFQRLPRHMRRRQMSHYIKRLPRRLQRPYLMSMKDAPPAPTKRPSRKYRRRPGNLLLEYNRRQKENVWLETHIWHAKRFHMIKKWGYKLPDRPVNKSFKACYRAISEHCLVTDNSYYNCIELQGPEKTLLEGLMQCTSPECGLTFGAKMYLSGSREGCVSLFHPNSYPYQIIGNVTFMWQPVCGDEENRKIWIWVHPLMHNETVECFRTLFNLSLTNNKSNETEEVSVKDEEVESPTKTYQKKRRKKQNRKSCKKIEQIKLEPKNVPFSRTPKYISKDESIVMYLLKDTLNRFQLTGPLSHAIISQAFDVALIHPTSEKNSDVEIIGVQCKKRKLDVDDFEIIHEVNKEVKPAEVLSELEEGWWVEYYKNDAHRKSWEHQKDFYGKLLNCCKPTDIASGMILSLVVGDPRLKISSKREKAVPNIKDSYQMPSDLIDPSLSQSPIWNPEIRDKVSLTKLTTHEINEARSKKIVPGFDVTDVIPQEKQSRVPILLVQRPGRNDSQFGKLGFGSGYDIIAPAGFGMPIWLSLIFRGARTGGLRESELLQLECHNLNGFLQPDSAAGEAESQSKLQTLQSRYFKLPPSKRANFIKLGVVSPFYSPWGVLVRNWISKTRSSEAQRQNFSVVRHKKVLRELNDTVAKFSKCQDFEKFLSSEMNCLVPIVIECLGKGNPTDLALICLPDKKDLKSLSGCKTGPVEPSHLDENEQLRKELKSEHLKLLKSLRRKRRKDRSKLKEDFANNLPNKLKWRDILKSNSAPSKECSDEYNAKMKSLWIPDAKNVENVVNSCCRKIVGFVVKGGFCFSKSVGTGVGYVTLPGLVEVLNVCRENKSKCLVLVRNRDQVQYRYGKLMVAVE